MPPTERAQRLLAGLLAGSLAACGASSGSKDEPPASASVATPSAVDVVSAVPRPDDRIVTTLGTAASSRAAIPSFVGGAYGYAPVASADVARALFDAADATPRRDVRIDRDLLACRVRARGADAGRGLRRSERRDAPLAVSLSWGTAREHIDASHGQGAATSFLLVPLVQLGSGDPWSTTVREGGDEVAIERTFDGTLPLTAAAGDVEIECRRVDGAARVEAVRDALWAVDRKLVLLGLTSGEPPEGLPDIERALEPIADDASAVAALVGWDDPRLGRRLGRRAELEERLLGRLVTARRAATDRARPPGQWVGVGRMGHRLEAKVEAMTCVIAAATPGEASEAPPWRCEVTVVIDNGARGDRSLSLYGEGLEIGGASLEFVDRFGRAARLRWPDDVPPDGIDRATVQTLRVTLEPADRRERLQTPPPPALPVAFELVSERRRHRLFRPAARPARLGRLPRPTACGATPAPAICLDARPEG